MEKKYSSKETTVVLHDQDEIIKAVINDFKNTKKSLDMCLDSAGMEIIQKVDYVYQEFKEIGKRNVKIRIIADITKNNIDTCKQIMKFAEVRHYKILRGGFGILDKKKYRAQSIMTDTQIRDQHIMTETQILGQYIMSNIKEVVKQQQYFIDHLWLHSIPAEIRIQEIKKGMETGVIEVKYNPYDIIQQLQNLIENSEKEILMIITSEHMFDLFNKFKIIDLIYNKTKRNIKFKIITSFQKNVNINKYLVQNKNIEILNIKSQKSALVNIFIIDNTHSFTIEWKKIDARKIEYNLGSAIYSDSKPTILSYITIFEDIQNMYKMYNHIHELYSKIKEYNKSYEIFIHTAAHDLRSPLQPILNLSENLVLKKKNNVNENESIKKIIHNVKRLENLAEDILDANKIDNNMFVIKKRKINFVKFVSEIIDEYNIHTKEKQITLVLQTNIKEIFVKVDKIKIYRVFANLLTNAIRVSKNKQNIIIRLRLQQLNKNQRKQLLVHIKDSGIGIKQNNIQKLFEKFGKSRTGSGLGLYISKGIIEAHNGKIWASTNKGKGSTFSFTIPIN